MTATAVDSCVFIHPTAVCDAAIRAGTRVWAFAHVMSGIIGTEIGGRSGTKSFSSKSRRPAASPIFRSGWNGRRDCKRRLESESNRLRRRRPTIGKIPQIRYMFPTPWTRVCGGICWNGPKTLEPCPITSKAKK